MNPNPLSLTIFLIVPVISTSYSAMKEDLLLFVKRMPQHDRDGELRQRFDPSPYWIIEAENVRKTFAWTPVLQSISCRIRAGEIVSIFGPNGAGKTTFLRVLATLLQPSAGILRVFGHAS